MSWLFSHALCVQPSNTHIYPETFLFVLIWLHSAESHAPPPKNRIGNSSCEVLLAWRYETYVLCFVLSTLTSAWTIATAVQDSGWLLTEEPSRKRFLVLEALVKKRAKSAEIFLTALACSSHRELMDGVLMDGVPLIDSPINSAS